jgi:hypothetical protein
MTGGVEGKHHIAALVRVASRPQKAPRGLGSGVICDFMLK